jgi:hypothetical protein
MPKSRPLTLAELAHMLPRIQATLRQFTSASPLARAATPSANGHKATRGPQPGAKAARIQDKLLGIIAGAKGGISFRELIKKSGMTENAVKYNLRRLLHYRKARVVGMRTQAKWFVSK